MSETPKYEPPVETPDNNMTLAKVREMFGTFIVKGANCVKHDNYRGQGDRVLINTTSEGIRGEGGEAFIDVALTIDDAKKVYESLKDLFENENN